MVNFRDIIIGIIAGLCLVLSPIFFITFFGYLSELPASGILLLFSYVTGAIFFIVLDHGKESTNEFSLFSQLNFSPNFLPFTRKSIINRFVRYHLALLKFVIFLISAIGVFFWLYIYSVSTNPKYYFFIPSSLFFTGISIGIIFGIICSILIFILGLKLDDGKRHYTLAICGFFGGSIGLIFALIIVSLATLYLLANKSMYFSKIN